MTVLGTLGFHAEKFLPAIRALPDVRKVIVYDAPGETSPACWPSGRRRQGFLLLALCRLGGANVTVPGIDARDEAFIALNIIS